MSPPLARPPGATPHTTLIRLANQFTARRTHDCRNLREGVSRTRGERTARGHAPAFGHRHDLIRGQLAERFRLPIRPPDVEAFDLRRLGQPEMSPQAVLAEVTRTRLDLTHLRAPAGHRRDSRADGV